MKVSGFEWDAGNWPKCGKHVELGRTRWYGRTSSNARSRRCCSSATSSSSASLSTQNLRTVPYRGASGRTCTGGRLDSRRRRRHAAPAAALSAAVPAGASVAADSSLPAQPQPEPRAQADAPTSRARTEAPHPRRDRPTSAVHTCSVGGRRRHAGRARRWSAHVAFRRMCRRACADSCAY